MGATAHKFPTGMLIPHNGVVVYVTKIHLLYPSNRLDKKAYKVLSVL